MEKPRPTHEEYFAHIGMIMYLASILDAYMLSTFRVLSGCPVSIAGDIFYTLDSFQAKQNMLDRITASVGDDEDKKLVEKITLSAGKFNTQRKQVAHATIIPDSITDIKSPFRQFNPKTAKYTHITKKSMDLTIDQLLLVYEEAGQAFRKLCEKRGVPPLVNF